jgi:UDP-N-acetyl-D-mannosaminuronate dehydrogenase
LNSLSSRFGNNFLVHDPYLNYKEISLKKNIEFTNLKNGLKKSGIVIILVAHKSYKNIEAMRYKYNIILDETNLLNR